MSRRLGLPLSRVVWWGHGAEGVCGFLDGNLIIILFIIIIVVIIILRGISSGSSSSWQYQSQTDLGPVCTLRDR